MALFPVFSKWVARISVVYVLFISSSFGIHILNTLMNILTRNAVGVRKGTIMSLPLDCPIMPFWSFAPPIFEYYNGRTRWVADIDATLVLEYVYRNSISHHTKLRTCHASAHVRKSVLGRKKEKARGNWYTNHGDRSSRECVFLWIILDHCTIPIGKRN